MMLEQPVHEFLQDFEHSVRPRERDERRSRSGSMLRQASKHRLSVVLRAEKLYEYESLASSNQAKSGERNGENVQWHHDLQRRRWRRRR